MSSSSKTLSDVDGPAWEKMSSGEIRLICCSLVSLLVSCVLWSSRKQEWVDEIYTWTEVNDPSLWHLYYAIQHGADGGMPMFYTTAWIWAKIFGSSALALRLYSCLAFCGALVVVWKTVRRAYGVNSTAFGVLMVWGTSALILNQNAEARYYGLYTLMVSIAIALYMRLAEEENPKLNLLAGAMLAQAALVLSHVLGVIYGGLILFALILFDATKRRFRIRVYLFHAAGWLALLVWSPAILASMAVGKPHSWIPMPVKLDVLVSYTFQMWMNPILLLHRDYELTQRHYEDFMVHAVRHLLLVLVAIVFLSVLVKLWRNLTSEPSKLESDKRTPLLIVAFLILTTPLILLILSYLVTPLFVSRYALPSAIGMAIILVAFADGLGLDRIKRLNSTPGVTWAVLVGVLVGMPVISALTLVPEYVNPESLDVPRLNALVPPGVPVVVAWQHDFFTLMRYSERTDRPYVFLLDWPTALSGKAGFVTDFHLMRNYRQVGYFSRNIEDQSNFVCTHPYFLVLDDRTMSWFDAAVKELPGLKADIFAVIDKDRQLIAVHKASPLAGCGQS